MKKTVIIILTLLVLIFIAYGFSTHTSNVQGKNIQPQKQETKLKENIYGLPLSIKDIDYTIFPVGYIYQIETNGKLSFSKRNYNQYNIKPNAKNTTNLVFVNNTTNETKVLTEKELLIVSFEQIFFNSERNKEPSEFILYRIIEEDSNEDGVFNNEDFSSLYLGTTNGLLFEKISKNGHDLLDYKIIQNGQKLIFRTIVDTDKDGGFSEIDEIKLYETTIDKSPKTLELNFNNREVN